MTQLYFSGMEFLPSHEKRTCVFSDDRRYRYLLKVIWDDSLPFQVFICLNPSTADEERNDPTVAKCIKYSRAWGRGGFCMLNIFAWRDTDPLKMKKVADPVGPLNTAAFLEAVAIESGCRPIAAWGNHGSHLGRGEKVRRSMGELDCLGMNIDGSPVHPLYQRDEARPVPYNYRTLFELNNPRSHGLHG